MKIAQKYGSNITKTEDGSTKGYFDYEKISKNVNETNEIYDQEILTIPIWIKCKCVFTYAIC